MRNNLLFLILVVPLVTFGQLSQVERQILQRVESLDVMSKSFLEQNVNINSGTLNIEGVKATGAMYDTAFASIGFITDWYDMPDSINRAGHLFAERIGTKGKRILLIGHLDTVFDRDSPFQTYKVEGDKAYGPGVSDMKGGNVIILFALKALYDLGLLDSTQIVVALHGDEESSGTPKSISRKHLISAAMRSDIALAFEPAIGFSYATVARRGSSDWELEVTGRQAHSLAIFSDDVGAGAVFEASRILHEFYKELSDVELLTFNPGLMGGGTRVTYDDKTSRIDVYGKTNIVSQKVFVKGGLRFISEDQKDMARLKMKSIVMRGNLPHTSAEIRFKDSYPAMSPTDGNMALLANLNDVHMDLGLREVKPFDPGMRGAADISFIAQYVDGLDGLGAMGGYSHSPKEFMDLESFNMLIKRTAIFIYRLTR